MTARQNRRVAFDNESGSGFGTTSCETFLGLYNEDFHDFIDHQVFCEIRGSEVVTNFRQKTNAMYLLRMQKFKKNALELHYLSISALKLTVKVKRTQSIIMFDIIIIEKYMFQMVGFLWK